MSWVGGDPQGSHPNIPSCAVQMLLQLWQVLGPQKALRAWGEATPRQSRVGQCPPWASSISAPHRNDGGCRKSRGISTRHQFRPSASRIRCWGHIFTLFGWGRDTGIVFPQDTKVLPPTQAWMWLAVEESQQSPHLPRSTSSLRGITFPRLCWILLSSFLKSCQELKGTSTSRKISLEVKEPH